MRIEAHTTYNLKVYQALSRVETFKKMNPKKCLTVITIVLLIVTSGLVLIDIFLKGGDNFSWLTLLPLAILGYFYYMYYISPFIKYKSADRLADIRNTFVFTEDNVEMISESAGYKGRCNFSYESLNSVAETNEFYFLCQDKTKVYVVNKDEVDDSDEIIISKFLTEKLGSRYVRCKY